MVGLRLLPYNRWLTIVYNSWQISVMKSLLLFLLLFLSFTGAYSQDPAIYGSVQSADDRARLPGAAVRLERSSAGSPDSVLISVTGPDGAFGFEQVPPGRYTVKINYLGFKPYLKTVQVQQVPADLGILLLEEDSFTLQEVQVIGQLSLGGQRGDTTWFNAAAFQTAPNANAENLVKKMPGIAIEDGKIQAQGEDVLEILVDGKPFFEGNVEAALKNLPAEMIASIQIFDKKSDQAEFSGFDDGERAKTINIVTKPDRKQGRFGQASLGYGTGGRYMGGASISSFKGDRRVTFTGVTNNINVSDYSIGETPGGGLGGDSDGNTTTHRAGINFNDEWGEKIEVSGNYSFERRKDLNRQYMFREYILPSDSGQIYTENSNDTDRETGQGLRMRLEYDMDDNNELVFKPRLSIQSSRLNSYFSGRTLNDYGPLNQSESNSTAEDSDLEFESELDYRHRFAKKGRTVSASLETDVGSSNGETYRLAENAFYGRDNPDELLDQYGAPENRDLSWEANISYTEPVGDSSRMQLEYEIGNRVNDADRRTFNRSQETGGYTLLDTLLSNTFKSAYLRQEVEIGYQYETHKLDVEVEAEYQRASLQNDQVFPVAFDMRRAFNSLLPSVEVEYEFTGSRNLRLDYRTRTEAPSVSDLQDVIDNSNPLHLRTGNPNLKQSYQNELSLRYKSFDPRTNKVFYARIEGSLTRNTIANSTFIANAPIELGEGIILEKGSQLTRPVNLNEDNWDIVSYVNYGQPVQLIRSNLSLSGSIGYSSRPGMVNDQVNFSNSGNFGFGAHLSSNISEKVDFDISTRSRYHIVENTLRPRLNNNYFNQSTRLRGNLIFWKGVVFRTELNHRLNAGLAEEYDNNYILWNMSISKTLFDSQRGEVSLSVNDLLKQNNSIDRNVTELYVEDERSNVLQQFFMLSFTYSIRHFRNSEHL